MKSNFNIEKANQDNEIKIETVTVADWNSIPHTFYKDISVKIITKEIIESGMVISFFQLYSGDFVALPVRFYKTAKHSATIDAVVKLNTIRIIWMNTALENDTPPPAMRIKVVTVSKRLKLKYRFLNFKNFKEICARFHLQVD